MLNKAKNYSRKREAILDRVLSVKSHPTAGDVYNDLKKDYPDLSLGTVYRNLLLFKSEGSISSVGILDGKERFDGNITQHGHFICERCHNIIDIDIPNTALAEYFVHLEERQKCRVHKTSFMAYGSCEKCVETNQGSM
ncbi:MAG: transcriptional repressor [Turicibacter sp.]|nr:transcriptional repressor [Turicibacter sp.]